MSIRGFSEADIDALIAGKPVAEVSRGLSELVGAVRGELAATPMPEVGAVLRGFIDTTGVAVAGSGAIVAAGHGIVTASHGIPIVGKIAASIGLLPVKIATVATVAAVSVGGAQALGVVDVPGLPDRVPVVVPVEVPAILDEVPSTVNFEDLNPPSDVPGEQGPSDEVPVSVPGRPAEERLGCDDAPDDLVIPDDDSSERPFEINPCDDPPDPEIPTNGAPDGLILDEPDLDERGPDELDLDEPDFDEPDLDGRGSDEPVSESPGDVDSENVQIGRTPGEG